MGAPDSPAPQAHHRRDTARLRPIGYVDLAAAHALSDALHWPHRPADWAQALRHAEGLLAERDGHVAGVALRFRWGLRHATLGLVIVATPCQGLGIGRRLMTGLLDGLSDTGVLLHATPAGQGLYESLGFAAIGTLQQHQGIALPAPLVALGDGWRLRPSGQRDLPALQALDATARGMPRPGLISDLAGHAEATVVLDHGGVARGFAMLRRFGRGHAIGPVVAPDNQGARALIAHLAGLNAGRFTRVDLDSACGLGAWMQSLGLPCVDTPVTMWRGPATSRDAGAPTLYAVATQALG